MQLHKQESHYFEISTEKTFPGWINISKQSHLPKAFPLPSLFKFSTQKENQNRVLNQT